MSEYDSRLACISRDRFPADRYDLIRLFAPLLLLPALALLALPASAGDFCGADCVLSEDFDDAVSGDADGTGTLPTGWVNVTGENVADACFGDPCSDWWVNDSVGNESETAPTPQVLFDHTDGLGNYLYVASDGNDNALVQLLSPTFTLDAAQAPYATFYLFSLYTGSTVANNLEVDIMDSAGTAVVSAAVLTVGDIGIAKWRPAFVDLDGTASGTYRLRFSWSSTFDQNDEGTLHDIAIDDFAVVADREAAGGEGGVVQQTHIQPAPEDDILAFLNEPQGTAANPIETYTGISIALDDVVIYYDEQEDGYENDVANPTQTGFVAGSSAPAPLNRSTQVWGDGYPQNGYPPGHPDDVLSLGEVIILREPAIDVNSLTAVLDYDAGDVVASSDEIAITRVFWASEDETLNAGAIELFPTDRWGSEYRIPFGEDITAAELDAAISCDDDDVFEEVALFVMADADGTQVSVDFNNGGSTNDFTTTLDRGESAFVGFDAGADGVDDLNTGATVTATGGRVQVHAFTADEGSNYGSRYYTILPVSELDGRYFSPFESATGGAAELVIFNPNDSAVDADIFTGASPATPLTTLTIPAGGFDTFVLPTGSADGASLGTRVESTGGETLYPIAVMDACDDAHDWGGSLLPEKLLTEAILIPVGFGSDPTNAAVENHSPIWVTPAADTFVYVDFDGDLVPDLVDLNGDGDTADVVDGIDESASDTGMSVSELQIIRVHDPDDSDQSGTLVFSLSSAGFTGGDPGGRSAGAVLAGGWGQDPDTDAPAGTPLASPAIDVGTAFAPITFPSSLPVSIASFSAMDVASGLEVRWTTVSETRNAGFYLWGDLGSGLELLTPEAIPAEPGDPLTPRDYRVVLPGLRADAVRDLAVTAVDYLGDEEVYGLFQPGRAYGVDSMPAPIQWRDINSQVFARSSMRGADPVGPVRAVDVAVDAAGMQSVSWQMLADAGLDLTGVDPTDIAVTRNGEPMPREMVSGSAGGFRPGDAIRFWGEAPAGRDALYLDRNVYRIAVAPEKARSVHDATGGGSAGSDRTTYRARRVQDTDAAYHLGSPLADPWYAARLRADRNNTYATAFVLGDDLVAGEPGRVEVRVGGLTDFPADPDHHVRVAVNGQVVGERIFEGQRVEVLDLAVPAGVLVPGANEVTVSAPGGTEAQFDISLVDTIALEYAAALEAADDRLLMPRVEPGGAFSVTGFSGGSAAVYAWTGERLHRLASDTVRAYPNPDVLFRTDFEPGDEVPSAVRFATLDEPADYWASTESRIHRPAVAGAVGENTLLAEAGSPDFLVIAHPAFLPLSDAEAHPLNDYIAQRESEGWTVGLFDVTALQDHYTGGMALPEAVNRFLADADARFDYEHVLLVGGDSYDYTDNLGLGSISFIPTHYAATRFIPHTPSDQLLADLDGDGLSDKAIGRWPVRSQGDLQAIVDKTLAWSNDPAPLANGVWVTDSQDPGAASFTAQAERRIDLLARAGWSDDAVERVYFDDIAADVGASAPAVARSRMFDRLAQGRSLTGFIGHGAPAMWTFQGLLTPDDLNDLANEGSPTLIGTMTCYTSYFVSPFSDTVAHRWMNGYREDGLGNRIPGIANGAVAIHGASTLSSYDQNDKVAHDVLRFQLAGDTLGRAVHRALLRAQRQGLTDQALNWTLLGDPTLITR